jgi:hypothetical protein
MAIVVSLLLPSGNHLFAQKKTENLKVGVYDSRVVTFAWSRSDFFHQILTKANQQSDSAEKANDTVRIKELTVEIIDLTNQIAKLFNPKENIDNMVGEIRKQDPVPLEQLSVETDMLDLYCKRFGTK